MLLSDNDRKRVGQMLAAMTQPVRFVFFTQSLSCDTCLPARQILDELVALTDKLSIEERNLVLDKDLAAGFGVDRAPTVALVAGERDARVRFVGLPSGYEFSALIDAVVAASTGQSHLSEASRGKLRDVTSPVRIQVFVTPT